MRTIFRYAALVLGLTLSLFFFLMSLDSFPHLLEKRAVLGFIIHMIPFLVTAISSIFAFRYPKPGFIIFLALSATFTIYFHTYQNIQNFTVITIPLLVVALLILSSFKKKGSNKVLG
jgi:hypothetical protein